MKQRPETEFIEARYTLHVDHTGYTVLRHVTIVGYANNGVPHPPWYKTALEGRYKIIEEFSAFMKVDSPLLFRKSRSWTLP